MFRTVSHPPLGLVESIPAWEQACVSPQSTRACSLFAVDPRIVGEGVSMYRVETAILVGLYALLAPLIIALALH